MKPATLFVVLLLCLSFLMSDLTLPAAERPHVLFFAVDDLRPELGCYGVERVQSPHLDRLAREGVVFRRAYCQQAVCSPSRTSLLTGLRPDSTKVYDLETHFRKTVPEVVTLPQHFKQNGYRVVGMGKIYHGGLNDTKSWSVPHRRPKVSMYQSPKNLELMARKREEFRKRGLKGRQLSRKSRGPAWEAADVPDGAYPDGALTEMAVAALRDLAKHDAPFFLAVGFLKPHLPFNAPKRYWDLYDAEKIRLADNPFPPRGAPRLALTNWGELRSYHDIPQQGPVSEAQARSLIHGYLACVSFIDAQVGRILSELEELGLREKTIIVLWGDHGWKLGEHGAWCKHTNFELDARSSLLLRAPGAEANGRPCDALVEFVDIYPTLCELAGLELPEHLEGTSFAPLLGDPARPWKTGALSQYPRGNIMGYSLRTDRYRFTRWQERKDPGKVVALELYDHKVDPAENVNLAGDPARAGLIEELTEKLAGGWKSFLPEGRSREEP